MEKGEEEKLKSVEDATVDRVTYSTNAQKRRAWKTLKIK